MTDDAYNRLQEEKCRAKHRYRSAQVARNATRSFEDKFHKKAFYYRCRTCHGYHLTSNDPKDYNLREFKKALHQLQSAGLITGPEMEEALRQFQLRQ